MVVTVKFAPVMLSFFSIKTKFFVQLKSSSISQFIKCKSRDLHKLLKYFNETTASVFKGGVGG